MEIERLFVKIPKSCPMKWMVAAKAYRTLCASSSSSSSAAHWERYLISDVQIVNSKKTLLPKKQARHHHSVKINHDCFPVDVPT